jgi:hypothetical protein
MERITMAFQVQANKRGWIFETIEEACAAADDVFKRRGLIVGIMETDKPATHKFSL